MAETITGLGDLKANFKKLGEAMERRVARAMVASGGAVLKKEAKQLAQVYGLKRTGALLKNIVIKRESAAPAGTAQYNLGVRHGRNLTKKQKTVGASLKRNRAGRVQVRYKDDPFYWRYLEFGWIPRGPGQSLKGGAKRKAEARKASSGRKIPGRSFIEKALTNKRQQAIDAMAERLQRELDKAAGA